jgi:APA family basic amino acid/polyamine antiporter
VWGYPFTPLLFLIVSAWYLANLLVQRAAESMVGIAIMMLGVPFYLYWRRARHLPR